MHSGTHARRSRKWKASDLTGASAAVPRKGFVAVQLWRLLERPVSPLGAGRSRKIRLSNIPRSIGISTSDVDSRPLVLNLHFVPNMT
jgi:hypothetical protein